MLKREKNAQIGFEPQRGRNLALFRSLSSINSPYSFISSKIDFQVFLLDLLHLLVTLYEQFERINNFKSQFRSILDAICCWQPIRAFFLGLGKVFSMTITAIQSGKKVPKRRLTNRKTTTEYRLSRRKQILIDFRSLLKTSQGIFSQSKTIAIEKQNIIYDICIRSRSRLFLSDIIYQDCRYSRQRCN